MHYQKKRSRELAMRRRWCMQKLVEESKNMDSGIRFTNEEDKYIGTGIEKFGFSWSKILHHLDFNFNVCRVPNTLRKRAEALKLV